jgi:hypothetical protein
MDDTDLYYQGRHWTDRTGPHLRSGPVQGLVDLSSGPDLRSVQCLLGVLHLCLSKVLTRSTEQVIRYVSQHATNQQLGSHVPESCLFRRRSVFSRDLML